MLDNVLNSVEKNLANLENTAEKYANPLEVPGEVLKAGEHIVDGTSNTLIQSEISKLDPFQVVSGGPSNLIGTLESKYPGLLKNQFTDISKLIGAGSSDSSVSDLGGSSVEAVLLQLASKERDRLADKVGQLKNLQAPGADATPQQQSDFDTTKANLMADIQSIENSIQQITTMATNVQKDENDTDMAIARNT